MKTKLLQMMMLVAGLCISSCDEDEPKTIPVLTTSSAKDITPTSASSGGEITSNGNVAIIASGLCWSSTNSMPTVDDDTTMTTTTVGSFASKMEGLTPSTVYYVRAYATNSVGTAYGNVIDFATTNAPPTVANVLISGVAEVNKSLTVTYAYSDPEGDAESGTTIQWYIASDGAGTGETAIAGASALSYVPQDVHEFKYIRVGITPKAAAGTTVGTEVKSVFAGPIDVRTTITFVYNATSVTYGIITSPVSGRKWLDRNLGAPNVPTAANDFANYGDLFQWGRGVDGHQLISRCSSTACTTSVNGTTSTLSATDNPGHGLFIISSTAPEDWRTPQNNNLWQGVSGTNNPCPAGFRLPTIDEWATENITNLAGAYAQMKLTGGGQRERTAGAFLATTTGIYWSSSISTLDPTQAFSLRVGSSATVQEDEPRGAARSCRCIKN